MGSPVWSPQIIVRALMEEGLNVNFGITGGHMNAIDDYYRIYGNRMYHMRHEQACAYAAEAYSKVTGKIGLCQATVGPGTCNMISAVNQAYYSNSPIIAILGQTLRSDYDRYAFQPVKGGKMYEACTKWTHLIDDVNTFCWYIRKAARDAIAYPPAPIALEIALDLIEFAPNTIVDPMNQIAFGNYVLDMRAPKVDELPLPTPSDEECERIVEWLFEAERPIIVIGHGGRWPDCGPELKEFAELTDIPFHERRACRGSVPEDHPLHIAGPARGRAFRFADRFLVMGLRFDVLEQWGAWGPNKRFVQVSQSPTEIWPEIATDIEAIGNVKSTLKKMSKIVRTKYGANIPKKTAWREEVIAMKERGEKLRRERAEDLQSKMTLPGQLGAVPLGQIIADFVNEEIPDATTILDSFTLSSWVSDLIKSRVTGGVLDAGIQGGVGHGVGMGIGAQVGRPGKPILALMGDAGMGNGGMDIETAYREDLPIVFVVYNNGCWLGGFNAFFGRDWNGAVNPHVRDTDKGQGTLTGRVPYGEMFKLIGCYGEEVTTWDQVRPALRRAFESGKTSVIDFHGDPDTWHSIWDSNIYDTFFFVMNHHLPEELWHGSEEGKERTRTVFKVFGYPDWPKAPKLFPPFDDKEEWEWTIGAPPKDLDKAKECTEQLKK